MTKCVPGPSSCPLPTAAQSSTVPLVTGFQSRLRCACVCVCAYARFHAHSALSDSQERALRGCYL